MKAPTHQNETITYRDGRIFKTYESAWFVGVGEVNGRKAYWYTDAKGERYYDFEPLPTYAA